MGDQQKDRSGVTSAKLIAGLVLAVCLTTSSMQVGRADGLSKAVAAEDALVDQGQFVSITTWNLGCGDTVLTTNRFVTLAVQKAVIYRNCAAAGTVARKADAILDQDGPCYSIPAGTARVLQAEFVFPRTVWRGANTC